MKDLRKRQILSLIAILLLGLFLVACGGGEEAADPPAEENTPAEESEEAEAVVEEVAEEEPEPTPEPEPTDEPEPTPEPEPTEEPEPEMAMVEFESEEGGYALNYPEEWTSADLFGFGVIASSEELVDSPEPGAEGAIAIFFSGPRDEIGGDDPGEALAEVAAEAVGDDEFEIVDGPTDIEINGNQGSIITYEAAADDGTPITGYFVLLLGDEHAVVMVASTPQADAETYLPVFESIRDSITLMDPVVAEAETESMEASGDLPASAGFLLYGDETTGSIAAGEPAAWDFIGLTGEVVDIVVTPDGELDVVVDVVDESGASILADGEVDESFDAEEILALEIPSSGTFYIVLRGFADSAGDYTLSIVESGGEVSSGDGASGEAGSIAYGDVVSGVIDESGTPAEWSFAAQDGDVVGVVVTVLDELDATIDVFDSSGNSILENSPRDASFGDENYLIEIPEDGTYTISVGSFDTSTSGEFELQLGNPLTNLVFAEDSIEEEDIEEGHAFPFTVFEAGEMVGIIVEAEDGLDLAIQVTQDGELVDIPGADDERGFDSSVGMENFVFVVPEEGTYVFRVKNSQDDTEGITGAYNVELAGSSNTVFELATGDSVAAKVNDEAYVEYVLNVLAGDSITFDVEPFTDSDFVIDIEDLDGNSFASVDDASSNENESATVEFTEDQLVVIRVSEFFGGTDAVFVLTVTLN